MPTERKEWWALQYPDGRLSSMDITFDEPHPRFWSSEFSAKTWASSFAKDAKPVLVRIEVIDDQA